MVVIVLVVEMAKNSLVVLLAAVVIRSHTDRQTDRQTEIDRRRPLGRQRKREDS